MAGYLADKRFAAFDTLAHTTDRVNYTVYLLVVMQTVDNTGQTVAMADNTGWAVVAADSTDWVADKYY